MPVRKQKEIQTLLHDDDDDGVSDGISGGAAYGMGTDRTTSTADDDGAGTGEERYGTEKSDATAAADTAEHDDGRHGRDGEALHGGDAVHVHVPEVRGAEPPHLLALHELRDDAMTSKGVGVVSFGFFTNPWQITMKVWRCRKYVFTISWQRPVKFWTQHEKANADGEFPDETTYTTTDEVAAQQ